MKRLLVKYGKQGDAVYLSHRETMRILERALRRSGIPLSFTEGYNPRPRMTFSPALPLGVAAQAEYLEVAVEGEADTAAARENINLALPAGLEVREIMALPSNMPKLSRWALYGLYREEGRQGGPYLLISLSGEKQGRLRDAVQALGEGEGRALDCSEMERVGLYASRDEVLEETDGPVYYYDGEKKQLEAIGNG